MERYKLELVGITYNQIESGVYAVILKEVGGQRRIPIIIGYPEAQAIECKLQDVVTPRPLTHDMMINFMQEFGIRLQEIEIRRLPSGVFAADLIFTDGTTIHTVDSRSSDAIALAIRADAPIYTSAEVLEEAGFCPEEKETEEKQPRQRTGRPDFAASPRKQKPAPRTAEELRELMQKAAENENYEEAARLKAELDALEQEEDTDAIEVV